MLRIPPAGMPTSLGAGLPLLTAVFAAVAGGVLTQYTLLCNLLTGNWLHVWWNLWLLIALGLACLVWAFAVARGKVGPATGTGLALAGFGVVARMFCEFLFSLQGLPIRMDHPPEIRLVVDAATAVRWGGMVAFAFGLAITAAACISEVRVRRRGPSWVVPP